MGGRLRTGGGRRWRQGAGVGDVSGRLLPRCVHFGDTGGLCLDSLGLADSAVADSHESLLQQLNAVLRNGDRVLTTWRHDGHCDHEAVGHACASASRRCQAQLLEVPVWAWHWAHPEDPRLPWLRARKLAVPAHTLERKRAALAARS